MMITGSKFVLKKESIAANGGGGMDRHHNKKCNFMMMTSFGFQNEIASEFVRNKVSYFKFNQSCIAVELALNAENNLNTS